MFFVLYKGASKELNWDSNQAAWVAACVTAGCMLASIPLTLWLRKRHNAAMAKQ